MSWPGMSFVLAIGDDPKEIDIDLRGVFVDGDFINDPKFVLAFASVEDAVKCFRILIDLAEGLANDQPTP